MIERKCSNSLRVLGSATWMTHEVATDKRRGVERYKTTEDK